MICENDLTDDTCLISSFSTAQFALKLFTQIKNQPYSLTICLLTYTEKEKESFSKLIEQQGIYRNKTKIIGSLMILGTGKLYYNGMTDNLPL